MTGHSPRAAERLNTLSKLSLDDVPLTRPATHQSKEYVLKSNEAQLT